MKKSGVLIPELGKLLFSKPVTLKYPFEKVIAPEGFRGTPRFTSALCIGCKACMRDCTAEAIEINQKPPDPNEPPLEPGAKPLKKFTMTLYLDRCTHCARCAEVCPKDAIEMDREFEVANFTREALKIVQD